MADDIYYEQVINGQGNPGDPIALYELECDGEETHITDCRYASCLELNLHVG